jgi:hypothetical protein
MRSSSRLAGDLHSMHSSDCADISHHISITTMRIGGSPPCVVRMQIGSAYVCRSGRDASRLRVRHHSYFVMKAEFDSRSSFRGALLTGESTRGGLTHLRSTSHNHSLSRSTQHIRTCSRICSISIYARNVVFSTRSDAKRCSSIVWSRNRRINMNSSNRKDCNVVAHRRARVHVCVCVACHPPAGESQLQCAGRSDVLLPL